MAVEIVAEVATNHGGNLALAKAFIDAFSPYVETIKFQLTRVAHLRLIDAQYEWFKRAEFTLDQFAELKRACEKAGVGFLVTVYNAADVWELKELGCHRVKIGSGETYEPTLRDAVREANLLPIVSYGIETGTHLDWGHHIALGCVTRYPAPIGVAAALMKTGGYDGWSDHAIGLTEAYAAICCGATMVETHVCLPGRQARPPQPWEKDVEDIYQLGNFAHETSQRFLGRWQV